MTEFTWAAVHTGRRKPWKASRSALKRREAWEEHYWEQEALRAAQETEEEE